MKILASFKDLPMYNFGVRVVTEMDDQDKAYLEANIQAALSIGEINLEDAIAIRQLKDVDQAERLLVVRRKKRIREKQEQAAQNSQMQAQANAQVAQVTSQGRMAETQASAQARQAEIAAETEGKKQLLQLEYSLRTELEKQKLMAMGQMNVNQTQQKEMLDKMKEDRKDERVDKQAVAQSKLISQRKGERPELTNEQEDDIMKILLQE